MPFDATDETPDEALLVAFANGDASAARILTLRLTPRVLGHAARMLGDRAEAEDVAQETMVRLWRMAPDWRQGEAQVTTWVHRVVSNLCTDRLRRRGRSVPLDGVAEPMSTAASVESDLIDRDRAAALDAALRELPDRQREAVVLRHLEGLSNPQIAAIMDISTEAVESLTARAKRTLSALLSGQKAELGYDDD